MDHTDDPEGAHRDDLNDIPGLSVEKISNADWVGRAAMLAHAIEADGRADVEALPDVETEDDEDVAPAPGHDSFVLRVMTHSGSPPRVQVQDVRTGAERQAIGLDRLPDLVAGLLAQRLPEVVSPPGDAEHRLTLLGDLSVALHLTGRVIREAEPFTVEMVFDISGIADALPRAPHISVSIFARRMGRGGPQLPLGRRSGELDLAAPAVTVPAIGLAAGSYRLESVVELTDRSGSGPLTRLASHYAELVVLPAKG